MEVPAMPAKASEEIKARTIRQTQKNGDIYVIERRTRYDPAQKIQCCALEQTGR